MPASGRSRLRVVAAAGLGLGGLGLGLGCGGIWAQAVARTYSEVTLKLEREAPNDPNFAEVMALLDVGFAGTWDGHCGLWTASLFQTAVDEALRDGRIDDGELVVLRDHLAECAAAPLSDARRAELKLVKASRDAQLRAETGAAEPAPTPGPAGLDDGDEHGEDPGDDGGDGDGGDGDGGDVEDGATSRGAGGASGALAGWRLPGDLEAAVARAGWTIGQCVDGEDAVLSWNTCSARRDGGLFTTVVVQRYASAEAADAVGPDTEDVAVRHGGAMVLEVSVADEVQAVALRDTVSGSRASVSVLDAAALRTGGAAQGWEVARCVNHVEGSATIITCWMSQPGRRAEVRAVTSGAPAVASDSVKDGLARTTDGGSSLNVSVTDRRAAEAFADALLR